MTATVPNSTARGALVALTLATVLGCAPSAQQVRETPPPEQPAAAKKAEDAPPDKTVARAVTADIQAGIEQHIETQSQAAGGYFVIPFREKELRLKLVRVHVEYLAALGPELNFACVDLVDTDGEVYDVDFFMHGPPDDMKVTETSVHKINGQPIYAWAQNEDKTWVRVPIDEASSKLLGVIEGKDTFEFVYRVDLPQMAKPARMWLPIPRSDAFQTVEIKSIDAPGKRTMLDEAEHGNKVLMLELEPEHSGATIEMRFLVDRIEKGPYAQPLPDPARYLGSDRLVPINDELRALGAKAVEGKTTDLIRARALYDHVIERMSYKKVGTGWGEGDAVIACDSRTGNCSDYHSYFIAISRAVGIPARFAVGVSIPSARDEGGISGYHCWAEFYADGKWWPIDISEADKYSNLSTYYFGHHPANRLELSRGRDLALEPSPAGGPINFLAYPLLEVGGRAVRTKPRFSFVRTVKP